jgi:hypothetical protein
MINFAFGSLTVLEIGEAIVADLELERVEEHGRIIEHGNVSHIDGNHLRVVVGL